MPDVWIDSEGFDEACPACQATKRRKTPETQSRGLLLHASLTAPAERPRCPTCQARLTARGTARATLHDLPIDGRPVVMHLSARSWRCPGGCLQPSPFDPLRPEGQRTTKLTRRLHEAVLTSWLRGEAVRTLARQAGVSEQLLWTLINDDVGVHGHPPHPLVGGWRDRRRLESLRFIGIDEIVWHGQALLVVVDLRPDEPGSVRSASVNRDHRLIDILPARDLETVERYLRDLDRVNREAGRSDWTPVVVTDMWGDYRSAIQRALHGRAIHIADRFHIALKVAEDLDHVIVDLTRRLQARHADEDADIPSAVQSKAAARAYLRASSGEAAKPDRLPTPHMREAADLARRLQELWTVRTPMEGVRLFRTWREEVHRWTIEAEVPGAFSRLIHLLDRESWLIETLNVHRPEARPGSSVADPDRSPSSLLTTARVERMIRRMRDMERRSPNHRRLPFAQEDQSRWDEEVRFHRYRARLLYALNTRVPRPATLQRDLQLIPERCCGALPDVDLQVVRRVADRPVMGARVVTRWEEGQSTCNRCGDVKPLRMPDGELTRIGGSLVRTVLSRHLLTRLEEDHSLTALHRTTGVPIQALRALRHSLPTPETDLPTSIGVVPFSWRRQRCLLITDIATGQPVELLRRPEGDWTPDALQAWLSDPTRAHVERIWVEKPEWIPYHEADWTARGLTFTPVLPQRVLDPFSSARLLQKSIRGVLDEYTRTMEISVRRARSRYRVTLGTNPDPSTWPVDERLRRRAREAQWNHLIVDQGLQYALTGLHDLKARLRARPQDAGEILRDWRTGVLRRFERAFDEPDDSWHRRVAALDGRLQNVFALALDGNAVGDALALGLQLAASPTGLSLARSRRRLRAIKELSLYRSSDWEHLRRVVLTGVDRD